MHVLPNVRLVASVIYASLSNVKQFANGIHLAVSRAIEVVMTFEYNLGS